MKASLSDALGRFRCFFEGDWQTGLAMLSGKVQLERNILVMKGSAPPESRVCISIADSWLAQLRTQRSPPVAEENITRHALSWYYRAWPLASEMERKRLIRMMNRLESRLLETDGGMAQTIHGPST